MQSKTTRAFRTISEAADELDLQPHVLRFWESKFPSFKPIKRGGGRRFYRPEDIEFLRGIKILLHDERHPIKDVQKLIQVKGAARVAELGRSIRRAAIPKDVKDTVLVPDHIQAAPDDAIQLENPPKILEEPEIVEFESEQFFPDDSPAEDVEEIGQNESVVETIKAFEEIEDAPQDQVEPTVVETPDYVQEQPKSVLGSIHSIESVPTGLTDKERSELETALSRLKDLKRQWQNFKQDTPPQ